MRLVLARSLVLPVLLASCSHATIARETLESRGCVDLEIEKRGGGFHYRGTCERGRCEGTATVKGIRRHYTVDGEDSCVFDSGASRRSFWSVSVGRD